MRKRVIIAALILAMSVPVHAAEMPEDIRQFNEEAEAETNVSRHLLGGIEYWESGFQDHAVNKAGTCFGLCQIFKRFHIARMERLGVTDICDRRGNIMICADILRELYEEYEDTGMVLLVYGGASEGVKARYLKDGSLPKWAQRIIDKSIEYEKEGENDRTEREAAAERDQNDGGNEQVDDSGNVPCGD